MLNKELFINFLANGIPVHIKDEEVELFYKSLEKFVNEADNEYYGLYTQLSESVLLSDNFNDYLIVTYSEDKVICKIADSRFKDIKSLDIETRRIIGDLFLGVFVYIEGMTSSDTPEVKNESWPL